MDGIVMETVQNRGSGRTALESEDLLKRVNKEQSQTCGRPNLCLYSSLATLG